MIKTITAYLNRRALIPKSPAYAYDIWAEEYDRQPHNLMLKLDEELLDHFLPSFSLKGKAVIDIGCGTGRHWAKINEMHPRKLTGFDISLEMLKKLKKKFPGAECYQVQENSILPYAENSIDMIISTLTMAHLPDPVNALSEWARVLSPAGMIYISDFHPQVLGNGGSRSFTVRGKRHVVKNYTHSIHSITAIFQRAGVESIGKKEIILTQKLRGHYESQDAMHVYKKFYGMPLIYGLLLKKS